MDIFIVCFILICYCLLISVMVFISMRKNRILTKRVDYLYFVLQFAELGFIGNELLTFKIPKTAYERIELVRKFCEKFRVNIIELSNRAELSMVDKIKVNEVVEELDAIINLLSTIDDKSSPGYINQILNELQVSVSRVTSIVRR